MVFKKLKSKKTKTQIQLNGEKVYPKNLDAKIEPSKFVQVLGSISEHGGHDKHKHRQ